MVLKRRDRELYDRLVELTNLLNQLDVEMRDLTPLKACFVSKDKIVTTQVPIATFREAIKAMFQHCRQFSEIMMKICECV